MHNIDDLMSKLKDLEETRESFAYTVKTYDNMILMYKEMIKSELNINSTLTKILNKD